MSRYIAYDPGDEVDVEVIADSAGEVARAGDLVDIRGENDQFTTVENAAGGNGKAVGMLVSDGADDTGDDADFSSGDSAGPATLYLFHPVIYLATASGYSSPSAGDLVQEAGVDVEAYTGATATSVTTVTNALGHDANGNLETEAGSDTDVDLGDAIPFGQVFSTRVRSLHIGDRVAVVKYR